MEEKRTRIVYPNLFYFQSICQIGGIESWFYYLSILYSDIDITVLYRHGDSLQINRLKRRFRCIEWNGKDKVECENLFINFNREILDYAIVHNKKYLVLHGDYLDMINRGQLVRKNLPLDSRVDEYIGISQTVCDSWFKLTGIMPKLSYNPVVSFIPLRQLRLISAQRMSSEKGGNRIVAMVRKLDEYCLKNDVDYSWDIYTTDDGSNKLSTLKRNKHINIHTPRLDINRLYQNYDYLISLTDNEGYCYTVVEALNVGTPCVVTPLPVFKELGIDETNSITLDFKLKNIGSVIEQMFNKKLKFTYTPRKDSYNEFLINKPNEYKFNREVKNMARIKALMNYEDKYEKKSIKTGDVYETTDERAKEITSSTYFMKANGLPMKYAEYTDDVINVAWQEPIREEKIEKVAEIIEANIDTAEEKPKKAPKKNKKKNVSKAE